MQRKRYTRITDSERDNIMATGKRLFNEKNSPYSYGPARAGRRANRNASRRRLTYDQGKEWQSILSSL